MEKLTLYNELKMAGNLEDGVRSVFHKAKGILERLTAEDVIGEYLTELKDSQRQAILANITGVEHIAFLLPENTDKIIKLEQLATEAGFPHDHKTFPSQIVSKELGSFLKTETVPTNIFKAWGKNTTGSTIGIEAFIPDTYSSAVTSWMNSNIGLHIALRVNSKESLNQITDTLKKAGFKMPEFMHNQPMINSKEGSITAYFDTHDDLNDLMRLEFYFQNDSLISS